MTYVPTAKRARLSARPPRGISWGGDARDAPRDPRGDGGAPRGTGVSRKKSRAGVCWIPDHVRHPRKYDCYVLDEPLLIGGGAGVRAARASAGATPGDDANATARTERGGGRNAEAAERPRPKAGLGDTGALEGEDTPEGGDAEA